MKSFYLSIFTFSSILRFVLKLFAFFWGGRMERDGGGGGGDNLRVSFDCQVINFNFNSLVLFLFCFRIDLRSSFRSDIISGNRKPFENYKSAFLVYLKISFRS